MIQGIIVGILTLGAVVYLVQHYYRIAKRKKQSGCKKCGLSAK